MTVLGAFRRIGGVRIIDEVHPMTIKDCTLNRIVRKWDLVFPLTSLCTVEFNRSVVTSLANNNKAMSAVSYDLSEYSQCSQWVV